MQRKIVGIFVMTLLIATFVPVSSHAIEFNRISNFNQNYINPPNDYTFPPIPGDMSLPHPDYNEIDASQRKSVIPKIFSQFTDDKIIDMIQAMDEPMILEYLENLTAFGPRVTQTLACHQAGDYICDEFESMGLEVRYHNWNYEGYQDRNIEGILHGMDETSDEIYIICAHYDSVPDCPGADDDGSGVAATMSAAFIMSQYAFNHTIRFVTFSGEEQWMLGSHEYAQEAFDNGDNIIAVLDVDMIGYAIDTYQGNNIRVYENVASQWLTNFTDDVSEQYEDYIKLNVIPSGFSWRSDHYSFWQVGYDATWNMEFVWNPYYHTPQDTIENMNITYNTKFSKLILATLAELAQIVNYPPNAPDIDGLTSGKLGTRYEFTFNAVDPDGDNVKYHIDWDDGDSTETGFNPSGDDVKLKHTWNSEETYTIKAKAEDEFGLVGPESTFVISITKKPRALNTPFQWFLQQYSNLFPMLQTLLQRLGLQ